MNAPLLTRREDLLARLSEPKKYDLVVVGGGATGLGVALDAALRGYSVALVEAHDFAKGTSSRATKLVHGGVRYLAQGNIHLVREALHERVNILQSAPHLAQPLPFIMPSYKLWETPFYGMGLKIYDALAGKNGLGRTQWLTAEQTLRLMPGAQPRGLKGGVKYWDGQFDDARLALAIARTAALHGAQLLNYCAATGLVHENGRVAGVACRDAETAREFVLRAGCVVNATGVWVDALRQEDARAQGQRVGPIVAPSQGVHVVVDQSFLPGAHALLVPSTADGRVLFAVPWLGKLILGTTDTTRQDIPLEPQPFVQEIDFILREAGKYLRRAPRQEDILSQWVGLRPLVRPAEESGVPTRAISREHTVLVSKTGLVTVTGGKWTTYRAMAEDVLEQCTESGLLNRLRPTSTAGHRLVGAPAVGAGAIPVSNAPGLHLYGSEAGEVSMLPGGNREIATGLSEAMVRFAVRHEYARTVEDVLARRSRLLFLDASEAAAAAAPVAQILAQELSAQTVNPSQHALPHLSLESVGLAQFQALARQYGATGQDQ
ncbi:glycerol-3-phosphate dehydrogenase/oxidase [Ottowia caeni]|uniref:glycerol-3-phosphate dehydrogenase/oxidase n=1 Tax=Ottowia caeni TaxID=2870339 RepID=UPI001E2D37A7|nr:glycerol-3-phosphate dehydrogenase/oxidase [Ottowia caeni]